MENLTQEQKSIIIESLYLLQDDLENHDYDLDEDEYEAKQDEICKIIDMLDS